MPRGSTAVDGAAAGRAQVDPHPVAACDGEAPAAQHAGNCATVLEPDGKVAPPGPGDEPSGRGAHALSASTFAAQMQSLSVTPLASCVE